MIAAEQFRRRLMSNRADIDCGYVIISQTDLSYDGELKLGGDSFSVSKISSIYVNNAKVPVSKRINIPSGDVNIRVYYKNLYSCDDMLSGLEIFDEAGTSLTTVNLDVSNLITSHSTSFKGVFESIFSSLSGLSNWDTSKATSFRGFLKGISVFGQAEFQVKDWDTSNVVDFSECFYAARVTMPKGEKFILDLSGWDTSKATSLNRMFYGCGADVIKMMGNTNPQASTTDIFYAVPADGTFYYNPQYDYSHILAKLPSSWTAIPVTQ